MKFKEQSRQDLAYGSLKTKNITRKRKALIAMSVWTHAVGFISIQNLTKEQIIEKLGTPISYEDMRYDTYNKNTPIPCGSEGSLGYSINESVDEIRIYGSLRDYSDYNGILSWIQKLADVNKEYEIDDCINYAEVELSMGEPPHKYIYNGFQTNGSWWDEYRIIPQKDYEEYMSLKKEEESNAKGGQQYAY